MPDRKSDRKSNFYLRDFRLPHKAELQNVRQKFQGIVRFVINRALIDTDWWLTPSPTKADISSLVRTASLPDAKFKTEVKNQYNRKKIVTTGIDFNPVTIKVLDTAYNQWLSVIMRYYSYNFMNGRGFSPSDDRDLKYYIASNAENINSAFKSESFNSNRAGYNINTNPYFFERIDYILYAYKKGVQYSLFNPVMTSFGTGDIDYSSNEPLEFDLSFEYESFTVHDVVNFNLSNVDLSGFETGINTNSLASYFVDPGLTTERTLFGLDQKRTSQQGKVLTPPVVNEEVLAALEVAIANEPDVTAPAFTSNVARPDTFNTPGN
jgi:hypothetical protein